MSIITPIITPKIITPKTTSKKSKVINKDKLITSLKFDTDIKQALEVIEYYILNPNHSSKYRHLTYVDEVVLLCLLKDVDVVYNDEDAEYYIDGQNVSSSIDKLIQMGYVHYETLKPNKIVLRRLYINHPFADKTKFLTESSIRMFLDYYIIEEFEQARSKWNAQNFVLTLSKAMELPRFENERISFCTFVNIAANKPRVHKPKKKSEDKYNLFDFNVSRLEIITSVLLNEIVALLK